LAERLKRPAATGRPHASEYAPVTVWIEAPSAVDASETLASTVAVLPAASRIAVVGGGVARTETSGRANASTLDAWQSVPVRQLDDLRALLDEAPEADVVVIEAGRELNADTMHRLAAAALSDSVCSSVSWGEPDDDAPKPERLQVAGAVPPVAIARPSWGLVYVRRDSLDLALDNARAVDGGSTSVYSVRDALEELLAGAGFVHRCLTNPGSVETQDQAKRPAKPRDSISVVLDMRHLVDNVTGTQIQGLGLLGALAKTGDVRLTAIVPRRLHPSVAPLVEPLRDAVTFSSPSSVGRADIFHRPHQIMALHDLVDCFAFGSRFVLTHQDMIAERSPSYFASIADWEAFRRTTSAAFESADHVGFFSEHAALDAASDGVLDPERATVVPLGVDHIRNEGPVERPASLSKLGGAPFMLVLGTAFGHKNRLFALRALRELIVEHGWDGGLVLAGMDAPSGSSMPEERSMLGRDPLLRDRVLALGHVTESQKRALYREAALTLFPSLQEGFGLVPFESAAFGTPCLYAWRSSLTEYLPRAGALPADFSVERTAAAILGLLESRASQESLVSEIRGCAAKLTWDETARGYVEVYRRTLAHPPRTLSRSVLGAIASPMSMEERAVLQVYRRRPAFRVVIDAVIRVGAAASRAARVGRTRS
jgi:glycosyltransferase involved in cell wall biosynthesis